MIQSQHTTCRGFTYIEFLLYISIASLILVAAGGIAVNVMFGKMKFVLQESVMQSHYYAINKIVFDTHSAQDIIVPSLGQTATELSLSVPTAENSPTVYSVVDAALYRTQGTSPSVVITPPNVRVDAFSVQRMSGASPGVQVVLTLTSNTTSESFQNQFSNTVTTTVFIK